MAVDVPEEVVMSRVAEPEVVISPTFPVALEDAVALVVAQLYGGSVMALNCYLNSRTTSSLKLFLLMRSSMVIGGALRGTGAVRYLELCS